MATQPITLVDNHAGQLGAGTPVSRTTLAGAFSITLSGTSPGFSIQVEGQNYLTGLWDAIGSPLTSTGTFSFSSRPYSRQFYGCLRLTTVSGITHGLTATLTE